MSTSDLTVKQRRFIEEYTVDWNATQAAIRAGYSPRTAHVIGCQNLKKLKIWQEIENRLNKLSMTAAEVLKRLTDIARGSMLPFIHVDDNGQFWIDVTSEEAQKQFHLIKKLKPRRRIEKGRNDESDYEIEWVEIELYSAIDALDKLARAHGIYRDSLDVNMSTQVQIIDFSADDSD